MYLTWASFNNIRMLMMACMPVVIFYLIWLVNTSEGIRSEEGTLLDLVCWPDGNAIPVIIACGSVIAVVIEEFQWFGNRLAGLVPNKYDGQIGSSTILLFRLCFFNHCFIHQLYGLHQLFKAGLPKREYDVTNGLFYYVWGLIIMIIIFLAIMFYSGLQSTIIRAKIKGGITKAMLRYSSHLPSKVAIDRLQTRFHCCGRISFQEWFFIPWYMNGEQMDSKTFSNHKFVSDNVPYSCCSTEELYPCIHHGITQKGTIYKYNPASQLTIWNAGCEEKLINEMMSVSWRFNAVMALIIIAMSLQVIAGRYLHTAYRGGLHVDNQITCKAYLLRSITDTEPMKNEVRKKMFKKKKFRQARTLHWVSVSYRRGKKRYVTSSPSEGNSSDELLKPIYE